MLRAILLVTLLFFVGAPAARAADPDLPQPDPPGHWRVLTHDDATSTSRCIGDPKTPLCAVETFLACYQRGNNAFCDMVEAGVRLSGRGPKAGWTEYRIEYARRPSALDPVDPKTEGPLKPQPGDVLIAVHTRDCYPEPKAKSGKDCGIGIEKFPPEVFGLRRQSDLWTNPYFFQRRF